MNTYIQAGVSGVMIGGLYAIMALGLSLTWGLLKVINLAHFALILLGAYVTFEFTANAFLQHMVRNLVGTLVAAGSGEVSPQEAAQILERRDRREAGVTAPPEGLALVEVLYPDRFELPRYEDEP